MGARPHIPIGSPQGAAVHGAPPPRGPSQALARTRGLLFDLDDVLYDATLWRRWLAQLLARLGRGTSYPGMFERWDQGYADTVHRGQQSFDDAFQEFLASLGLTRGQVDEVVAATHARRRELAEAARPLPCVRSTLGRLGEAGFALAVLCDAEHSAPAVREQLAQLGLAECFRGVVSSFDLGRTMPDPLCYATALTALGCEAAESAYVGHSKRELAGARRAGLRTIAFNSEPDTPADIHLARFDELLHHLPARQASWRALQGAV